MNKEKETFYSQQVLVTLFSATNKIQMHGDKCLQDLSIRQLMVMTAIIHLPDGEATNINIARMLGTTRQSTKQIVTLLEKKGYLSTALSKSDKRALNIIITARGKQILQSCSVRSDTLLSEIFHEFTLEELETLWTLLRKLHHFDGAEYVEFEKEVNYLADDACEEM